MNSVLIPILYTLYYALLGVLISFCVFAKAEQLRKIWLGLVFGLFGMTWMPSLVSFISNRFSVSSNLIGCFVFFLFAFSVVIRYRHKLSFLDRFTSRDIFILLSLLPILFIGFYLFSTHIIQEKADGLYVGQTTYGDLAMHLGFISSIATQGIFPPQYSIFPGHTINYPFLCEVSASSLYLLGADLRWSYLITALYAYLIVILGVFELFSSWLHKQQRAVLATYIFFIGGGFGFAYFLNHTNSESFVASVIHNSYNTNFSQLLHGFYTTPTNLPDLGLRWVNPIVDMLIPQRATLFGWAFLFPCLTLLHDYTFNENRNVLIPLGILAGGLPLIHTHSFLALGVISAVYFVYDIITNYSRSRLLGWLIYGGLAFVISFPQLFSFTFQQVSESSMVKLHFNWANEKDSWFWFYLKNWGVLFLTLLPGMAFLSKRDRVIMFGPFVLWGLSEIIIFQPNTYDNNKLIFIFFAYLCGLSAKFICVISHKLKTIFQEETTFRVAYPKLIFALSLLLILFNVLPSVCKDSSLLMNYSKHGDLLTLLFIGFLLFLISAQFLYLNFRYQRCLKFFLIPILSLIYCCTLAVLMVRNMNSITFYVPRAYALIIFILESVILLYALMLIIKNSSSVTSVKAFPYAFFRIAGCITICLIFLSGIMTIARECVSSYQVFNNNDLEASEFIKAETPSDSVFLTSYGWHLNTVSVLTGRNIVCGPDLFLFYHGIDTSERKHDIDTMYNSPENAAELFKKYNISYLYIGNDERNSFTIDFDYIEEHFKKVYDSSSISIYQISDSH